MTVRITHTKVSGKAAGNDSTKVYGTHWDSDHTIAGLPTSTTDNAIARFDGTTGDFQNSVITVDDVGLVAGATVPLSLLALRSPRVITSGNVTVANGDSFIILNKAGSAGDVTINPDGDDTVMGLSSWTFGTDTASGTSVTLPSIANRSPDGQPLFLVEWNTTGSGRWMILIPSSDLTGWIVLS